MSLFNCFVLIMLVDSLYIRLKMGNISSSYTFLRQRGEYLSLLFVCFIIMSTFTEKGI